MLGQPVGAVTKLTAQQLTRDPGWAGARTFIKITNVSGIDLDVRGRRKDEYPGAYQKWSDSGDVAIIPSGTPEHPTVRYIQTDFAWPDGTVRCLRIAPADTQYNKLLGVFSNGPRSVFVMHEYPAPGWFKIKVDALFVDSTQMAAPMSADPMGILSLFFGGISALPKVLEPQDYVNNPSEFQKLITKRKPNNPDQYAVTSGFALFADDDDPGLKIYCSTSDINDAAVNDQNTEFTRRWEDPIIEGAVKPSETPTTTAASH
jgi:hypothetical protein